MTDHRLSPERRDRFRFILGLLLIVLAGEIGAVLWK